MMSAFEQPRNTALRDERFNRSERSKRSASLRQKLDLRRRLIEESISGESPLESFDKRSYPVMAALVPVATSRGNEVAYPGDPMCLYSALSLTVQRSVLARSTWSDSAGLDDACADWGVLPSLEYRFSPEGCGQRQGLPADNPTTDGRIFDPRIWDRQAKQRFEEELQTVRPHVLLLSAVSAAHRYALEMAAIAKQLLPTCIVVLGGRHADETVVHEKSTGAVSFRYSSTARFLVEERGPCAIDFVVSGDGAPLLDLLLQAVALVPTESESKPASHITRLVMEAILDILADDDERPGTGVIVHLDASGPVAIPLRGRQLDASEMPNPYSAFSIRARFSIFESSVNPSGKRTAHMMTMSACPFQCTFCSESIRVSGQPTRFAGSQTAHVVERVREIVAWGAEAAFFDDPIFWGGNWETITQFASTLVETRASEVALSQLEWGAQLTVDTVLRGQERVDEALSLMRLGGCTYIYLGIESMSEQVMQHVQKNMRRRNPEPWKDKVTKVLSQLRSHGFVVGSSVLFGLDGENRSSIDETIEEIGVLLDNQLLALASPNILTYHPATEITRMHRREEMDYHSRKANREPYIFFEEAYPDVVSILLSEDDIWHIHRAAETRWGEGRNRDTEEPKSAMIPPKNTSYHLESTT
jgi:radical SAM superfamily enzyme YgiQ (UPF0313 family)